jgi:4-amino-4-deoxy-L-arabinose transferase-like glycosyltransferase
MTRNDSSKILLVIIFYAALTSVLGLTAKGVQSWDEGTYYTEARFVHQTTRAAAYLVLGKLFPQAGYPDLAALKETVNGLPPSMGRPLNMLVNAIGLYVFGEQPWVPALMSVLEALGCLWLVYLIMARLRGERAGLLAAALLALSAYFLPYRRLGMCEVSGALGALVAIWYLVAHAEDVPGSKARRHSWWLGVLCGLAFGLNTRTLLLLPTLAAWRGWHRRGDDGAVADRWWVHGARVMAGFVLMIALYQLPYLVIRPVAAHLGHQVEDYLGQMHRFATGQKQLGGVGLAAAYSAPAYFLLRNEGPSLALFVIGLVALVRRRKSMDLLLPSLWFLPLLQMAVLIPYARYVSWLLPILAMIGAVGLEAIRDAAGQRSTRLAPATLVVALALCGGYGLYRGLPVMTAQSRHAQALQWCRDHGAVSVLDTGLGTAYAQTTAYDLHHLQPLPTEPREAARVARELAAQGPVMVICEAQQFMKFELIMSPEEYASSTAGLLAASARPVYRIEGHLRGMFPFLCFEHNRLLPVTLQTLEKYQENAAVLQIYRGSDLMKQGQ